MIFSFGVCDEVSHGVGDITHGSGCLSSWCFGDDVDECVYIYFVVLWYRVGFDFGCIDRVDVVSVGVQFS